MSGTGVSISRYKDLKNELRDIKQEIQDLGGSLTDTSSSDLSDSSWEDDLDVLGEYNQLMTATCQSVGLVDIEKEPVGGAERHALGLLSSDTTMGKDEIKQTKLNYFRYIPVNPHAEAWLGVEGDDLGYIAQGPESSDSAIVKYEKRGEDPRGPRAEIWIGHSSGQYDSGADFYMTPVDHGASNVDDILEYLTPKGSLIAHSGGQDYSRKRLRWEPKEAQSSAPRRVISVSKMLQAIDIVPYNPTRDTSSHDHTVPPRQGSGNTDVQIPGWSGAVVTAAAEGNTPSVKDTKSYNLPARLPSFETVVDTSRSTERYLQDLTSAYDTLNKWSQRPQHSDDQDVQVTMVTKQPISDITTDISRYKSLKHELRDIKHEIHDLGGSLTDSSVSDFSDSSWEKDLDILGEYNQLMTVTSSTVEQVQHVSDGKEGAMGTGASLQDRERKLSGVQTGCAVSLSETGLIGLDGNSVHIPRRSPAVLVEPSDGCIQLGRDRSSDVILSSGLSFKQHVVERHESTMIHLEDLTSVYDNLSNADQRQSNVLEKTEQQHIAQTLEGGSTDNVAQRVLQQKVVKMKGADLKVGPFIPNIGKVAAADHKEEDGEETEEDTSTIYVEGISSNTPDEMLMLFFESKRRCGGGEITSMEFDAKKGSARITFAEENVVNNVLHHKGDIIVKGARLTVSKKPPADPVLDGDDRRAVSIEKISPRSKAQADLTVSMCRDDNAVCNVFLKVYELKCKKPLFGRAKAVNADVKILFTEQCVEAVITVTEDDKTTKYEYKKNMPEDIDPAGSEWKVYADETIKLKLKKAKPGSWERHIRYLMSQD